MALLTEPLRLVGQTLLLPGQLVAVSRRGPWVDAERLEACAGTGDALAGGQRDGAGVGDGRA